MGGVVNPFRISKEMTQRSLLNPSHIANCVTGNIRDIP